MTALPRVTGRWRAATDAGAGVVWLRGGARQGGRARRPVQKAGLGCGSSSGSGCCRGSTGGGKDSAPPEMKTVTRKEDVGTGWHRRTAARQGRQVPGAPGMAPCCLLCPSLGRPSSSSHVFVHTPHRPLSTHRSLLQHTHTYYTHSHYTVSYTTHTTLIYSHNIHNTHYLHTCTHTPQPTHHIQHACTHTTHKDSLTHSFALSDGVSSGVTPGARSRKWRRNKQRCSPR